ncbi:MAG: GNAT family N-acetyltransferase [Solirubrobacteraceae bacterium]
MGEGPGLETERLLLRRWQPADLDPFAAMNADPAVMEHFPATLSRRDSGRAIARIEAEFEREGFGLWAVEVRGGPRFAGFVGLTRVEGELPFAPAVEVGWRLARAQWGRGLATEAAGAALEDGFARLALAQIVAYTAVANLRSRRVMERLGMRRDRAGDFVHPLLGDGHRLGPHVLYRLRAEQGSSGPPAAERA